MARHSWWKTVEWIVRIAYEVVRLILEARGLPW